MGLARSIRRSFGAIAVAVVVAAGSAPAAAASPERSSFIVVFKDSVGNPHAEAREQARNENAEISHVYEHAIKGYAASMSETAAVRIARNPRVAWVDRDGDVQASAIQESAPWGLDRIDHRALALDGNYTYAATGKDVTAYIIDTGIRISHEDFGGRATYGRDTVGNDDVSDDCNGHGTHVAGSVGGTTYGVAKEVSLVAVRVLDCKGSGTWSGVIAGVDWVTGHHSDGTPAVANMSLGGGGNSSVDTAVRNSIADGITYSVAAGNGNSAGVAQDACNYSPARVTEALTVGATDRTDKKASWSNYGTCLDLFAPGVSITSAWYTSDTSTNTISGTSMAAPHVAGVAALHLQSAPTASAATIAAAVVGDATADVVSSAGPGSPNLLLHGVDAATETPTSEPTQDPNETTPVPPALKSMSVTVVPGQTSRSGKNYSTPIEVRVTDADGPVSGAAVALQIGTGECPVSTSIASGSGTTDSSGKVTFTYRTKTLGLHCAAASATKSGYDAAAGSASFNVQ